VYPLNQFVNVRMGAKFSVGCVNFKLKGLIWDVKVLAAANVEFISSVGGSRFLRNVGIYKSTRCHILGYCKLNLWSTLIACFAKRMLSLEMSFLHRDTGERKLAC